MAWIGKFKEMERTPNLAGAYMEAYGKHSRLIFFTQHPVWSSG